MFGSQHHRDGYKTAFGKDHVRFIFFQKLASFPVSFYHAEGVGEIFQIEVAAQFAGGYPVIGDPGVFDEFFLNALIRANIADLVS